MENHVKISQSYFEYVIAQLKDSEFNDIADELQKCNTDSNPNNNCPTRTESQSSENSDCNSWDSIEDSPREDNFHTKLQVTEEPLTINVKKSVKFRDTPNIKHMDSYTMRSNPRGYVLIIANSFYKKLDERRLSAKHDATNLTQLFTDMGFKVINHYDLTGEEILKRVEEFSKLPELRLVDSVFVIISSHGYGAVGQQETEIHGIDYDSPGSRRVVCTNIMNYFTVENCKNLSGKPKIFIFQTCRGTKEQIAIPRSKTDVTVTSQPQIKEMYVQFSETMRNYEDILIVYSTIPGYVSYRDTFTGSWFIQILCEVFMNYAHKVHVYDLFNMIDYRLKVCRTDDQKCQTPTITSQGFNRHCYINPGLFKNINLNGISNSEGTVNITFSCCPERKANIYTCIQCESVYHHSCAKKLSRLKALGKTKADCCSKISNENDDNENNQNFSISKSCNENVQEFEKVVSALNEEKVIINLSTQHSDVLIADEINFKKSQQSTIESQNKEIDLLNQLIVELKIKSTLLNDKIDYLSESQKNSKKSKSIKNTFRRVWRRKKQKTTNVIEPAEI